MFDKKKVTQTFFLIINFLACMNVKLGLIFQSLLSICCKNIFSLKVMKGRKFRSNLFTWQCSLKIINLHRKWKNRKNQKNQTQSKWYCSHLIFLFMQNFALYSIFIIYNQVNVFFWKKEKILFFIKYHLLQA